MPATPEKEPLIHAAEPVPHGSQDPLANERESATGIPKHLFPEGAIVQKQKLWPEARRRAAINGTLVREEHKKLAQMADEHNRKALDNIPEGELLENGTWKRVSLDIRWPFGADPRTGEILAPYGVNRSNFPITDPGPGKQITPQLMKNKSMLPSKGVIIREAVIDKLEKLECDPIAGIAEIAMNKKNPPHVRLNAYAELAQYAFPKKRSVEFKGETKQHVFVIGMPSNPNNPGQKDLTPEDWVKQIEQERTQKTDKPPQEIIDLEAEEVLD